MQETEKIWMNGELVDWADARVHVGTHGLHYGTGVFEGIRCYDTERGPAVFRLTDHLKRLENSAKLLYMELAVLGRGAARPPASRRSASNGLERVLPPTDRVLRLRRARRPHRRQPGRRRDHVLPVGRLPRRGGPAPGDPRDDLVLAPGRPEHDPARREGDRRLPELDARHARGAPRGLRRGDHADRGRQDRRRPRRDDLHGQGRDGLHAGPVRVDPAGDHPRHDHPDRPGPRATRSSRSR